MRHRKPSGGEKNYPYIAYGIISGIYTYVKTHQIVHFKYISVYYMQINP